jgi:spore coat protein U-like protein
MKMRVASWTLVLLAAGVMNASALDRRVQINNVSSYIIMEFYASNTGTSDWQEDILGNDVLAPGSSVMVNIDDSSGYCKYDFLAVFEDGDQAVSADNNVCELTSFDFTD